MFTLDQIKEAHSKVKSGADFPIYVQDLIKLDVTSYDTFVDDGRTNYIGKDNYQTQSLAEYPAIAVAEKSDIERFTYFLKIHQQGETDYLTFCKYCAQTGVEKWIVDLVKITCTYYDKAGNKMAVEKIPIINNCIFTIASN